MVNVSLVVYYTEQFARSTGDVRGTIYNLVNEANQAYRAGLKGGPQVTILLKAS